MGQAEGDLTVVAGDGTPRVTVTAGNDSGGGRAAPIAGVIVRDQAGRERGGIGCLDVADGSAVMALDHHGGGEGITHVVGSDGRVLLVASQTSPHVPRLVAHVAPDGEASIELRDPEGRPRLRFSLADDGAGVIEFLRADGTTARSIRGE